MADNKHSPHKPPVKEDPPQKHNPSPNLKPTDDHKAASPPHLDEDDSPVPLDTVAPVVRRTETLPVEPTGREKAGDPVGFARHAETPEEVEKLNVMEHSKIPPPGSRNYIAGQPVDEEEYERTEREANRLAEEGRRQRTEAEQRMKENTPGDPDYHPADPDHRDTPQALSPPPDKDKK